MTWSVHSYTAVGTAAMRRTEEQAEISSGAAFEISPESSSQELAGLLQFGVVATEP